MSYHIIWWCFLGYPCLPNTYNTLTKQKQSFLSCEMPLHTHTDIIMIWLLIHICTYIEAMLLPVWYGHLAMGKCDLAKELGGWRTYPDSPYLHSLSEDSDPSGSWVPTTDCMHVISNTLTLHLHLHHDISPPPPYSTDLECTGNRFRVKLHPLCVMCNVIPSTTLKRGARLYKSCRFASRASSLNISCRATFVALWLLSILESIYSDPDPGYSPWPRDSLTRQSATLSYPRSPYLLFSSTGKAECTS